MENNNSNNNIKTLTVTQFTHLYYKRYKKLMNAENLNLPSINPVKAIEKNKTVNSLAFILLDEVFQPTVNIYLQPELPLENIELVASVLSHEFTHILDANTICKNIHKNDLLSIMALYSEYHATQVQYSVAAKFEYINCPKPIDDINKPFIYTVKNKKISISEDLKYLSDSITYITNQNPYVYIPLNALAYLGKYKEFESGAMYYLSKIDFCKKYAKLNSDVDLAKNFGEFTPYIKRIHQDILSKNFRSMVADRQKLWMKFNVKFHCSDFGNLPKNINN